MLGAGHIAAVLAATAQNRALDAPPDGADASGPVCTPHRYDDVDVPLCQSWCTPAYARDHCPFCKCTSCAFCHPSPPTPPSPPPTPPAPPLPSPPPSTGPAYRLTAQGTRLVDPEGRSVVLQGVNTYLEWYKDYYGALDGGSSALDVPHLRRALPAANCVRFVGLLWKDSIKASDGLECFVNDASKGYLEDECVRYIDAMVKQATDAGLWVILAARAKYAAGWSGPDVWHSATMRRQMLAMWSFVARRYKDIDRIAGYEIMSEPRTKTVAQARVRDFMREGA